MIKQKDTIHRNDGRIFTELTYFDVEANPSDDDIILDIEDNDIHEYHYLITTPLDVGDKWETSNGSFKVRGFLEESQTIGSISLHDSRINMPKELLDEIYPINKE